VDARALYAGRAPRSPPLRANDHGGQPVVVGDDGVSRRGETIASRAGTDRGARVTDARSSRHRSPQRPSGLMALDALLDAIERLPAFARVLNTLPVPAARLSIGGLPGSADAALVASLSRRLPTRFFVIAAEGVAEAERWLADLETLTPEGAIALYPAREAFGEAEPHMEVAGERIETLERLTRGELRILLTTARALLEKTRMPRALQDLRIELRKGDTHRLGELSQHLESIGFERVPMVE